MSDFDKEAEREKLREKYEQDKEERKATQRMSDLLLKGATMTNAHCGTCGDPLFQHDGTTFCPSCHGNPDAVEGTDLEAEPAEEGSTTDQPATERSTDDGPADATRTETTNSTPDATDIDRAANADATSTAADQQQTDDESPHHRAATSASSGEPRSQSAAMPTRSDRQPASQLDAALSPTDSASSVSDAASAAPDASNRASDDRSADPGSARRGPAASSPPVDGDLEAARDALVRTLEKFAAEAAAADDPRYARDCLEAAREAGETLSTLR